MTIYLEIQLDSCITYFNAKNLEYQISRAQKDVVIVDSDSSAGRKENKLDKSEIDSDEIDNGEVGDNEIGKKVQKTSKFKNLFKSEKTIELDFLILGARLAFTKLR